MAITTNDTAINNNNPSQGISSHSKKGYAYNDDYGFAHVVKEYETAIKYSGDGKIYSFEGDYGGGYALDVNDNRARLDLPDTKAYGNDIEEGHTPEKSEGSFVLLDHFSRMQGTGYNVQIPDLGVLDDEKEDKDS